MEVARDLCSYYFHRNAPASPLNTSILHNRSFPLSPIFVANNAPLTQHLDAKMQCPVGCASTLKKTYFHEDTRSSKGRGWRVKTVWRGTISSKITLACSMGRLCDVNTVFSLIYTGKEIARFDVRARERFVESRRGGTYFMQKRLPLPEAIDLILPPFFLS